MSGARIIFPEFRDEQSDSRYPFADSANLMADTGNTMPRDAFIDASLYVINATAPLYVSSIAVGAIVTITIGDAAESAVATASYNPLSVPENGVIDVMDTLNRPAGMLIGNKKRLEAFGAWEPIVHDFSRRSAEFVASVVVPAKEPGVRAVTATDTTAFLTGDMWLIGRRGISFRQTAPNTIRVDIVGVPLFKRAECLNDLQQPIAQFAPKRVLQTINNCPPDKFGNFTIAAANKSAADTTLRVYVENDALKIAAVATKVI